MGAWRKTQTIPLRSSIPGSIAPNARNLQKSDLGGVIFGCKHNTIKECLSKQLFGLPALHISYVRNIEPGLPLFLFNYSNRKLHGIYEAASCGEMNIELYAWTDNTLEKTVFPAQVRICIKTQCQPLSENQFKKVIEDNYYSHQHFCFELDHSQTQRLIALFRASTPSGTSSLYNALPATKWKANDNSGHGKTMHGGRKTNKFSVNSVNDQECEFHFHAVTHELSNVIAEENAFQDSISEQEDGWLEPNLDISQPVLIPNLDGVRQNLLAECSGGEGIENKENILCHIDSMDQTLWEEQSHDQLERAEKIILSKLEKLSAHHNCLDKPSNGCINDFAIPMDAQNDIVHKPLDLVDENTRNPAIAHENSELVEIIKMLVERTAALEKKQVESENIIQQLRDRVGELESKHNPPTSVVDSTQGRPVGLCLGTEVIYLIGGYDGSSWLSALDAFSPSTDVSVPLKPMSSARSYASAAALNGNIYVFGGGDGSSWYNTVECYDQRKDEWTLCPPLIRAKGSLAGAALSGKIFAIGGGDGSDCFSDVEMFDPVLGRWLNNQPMLQKRFALAAAELHGALYAVGGYDGKDYLKSAERCDPREAYWTCLPGMKTKRGCHSLAVFNDKLYAMGGYDGEEMVSSIEIFDPRMESWTMGEPMSVIRGYAASVVLGDSLFVIGGIKDGETIVDIVECYGEGSGWTNTGLKAIGKRCFFSAIVL